MHTSSPRQLVISESLSPLTGELAAMPRPRYRVISPKDPSPVQQVLNTAELLAMIVDYFNGGNTTSTDTTTFCKEPPMRTDWKCKLAPLTRVSKAFSRAAIDILWQTMDSLRPFLALLKADYTTEPNTFPCGITAEAWTRFEAYSRLTKILQVDESDMHMSPCWGFYIVMSPNRPQSWFPALRQLYMGSASSLAFVIALSPCSALRHVQINFDSGAESADANSAAALTASLSQHARHLTSISIVRPVNAIIIQNLSNMACLRHLSLRLNSGGAGKLSPLIHLPLESLNVSIAPCEGDIWDGAMAIANLNAKPPTVAHSLSTLRRLTVSADGNGQMIMATIFRPGHLVALDLDVLYHDDSRQTSLEVPRVLFLYLGWNKGLRSLKIKGTLQDVPDIPHSASSLSDFTPQFLSHLSSLKLLEVINITGVYLSSPGLIVDMLQMLPNFERLRLFRFAPRAPTRRSEIWTVPTFDHLYQISKGNTPLSTLSIPVLHPLCILVPRSFGSHTLQNLALQFYPGVQRVPSTDDLVALSLYLHRLFPFLTSVTCEPNSSTAQQDISRSVQSMLFAYHRILAKPTIYTHPCLALQGPRC